MKTENIKTQFGFSSICVGKYRIYTGKLRFKDITYTDPDSRIQVNKFGRYTTISYETLCKETHEKLSQKLGRLCHTVAQNRLNQKYGWVQI